MEAKALFIYYKVDPQRAQAFEQAARQMQAALVQRHEGLAARLWRRGDASPDGGQQTWMESYEHPQGVDAGLMALIDRAAQDLPEGRVGPRHIEMFVSLD